MNKRPTDQLRQGFLSLSLGLVVLLGSLMGASPSWGWGDLGHKIICQIAFQELNDKARTEVIRLIALDETFNSFTDACTWPDHPRKRAEEHFVNVARSVHTITVSARSHPSASSRLSRAISKSCGPPTMTRPSWRR